MDFLLRSLGLSCGFDLGGSNCNAKAGCISESLGFSSLACAASSGCRSDLGGNSKSGLRGKVLKDLPSPAPLINLEELAATTERAATDIEHEGRRLAHCSLAEALSILTRWAHALKARPRPEEPPATFRAAFLRSEAVSLMLSSLGANPHLRASLLDPPLFVRSSAPRPEAALLEEATLVLKLAFRRAASPAAGTILQSSLGLEPSTGDFNFATAAGARSGGGNDSNSNSNDAEQHYSERAGWDGEQAQTVRAGGTSVAKAAAKGPREVEASRSLSVALKDDWLEAARSQASRRLERHVDALSYELQKTGGAEVLRRTTSIAASSYASRSRSMSIECQSQRPAGNFTGEPVSMGGPVRRTGSNSSSAPGGSFTGGSEPNRGGGSSTTSVTRRTAQARLVALTGLCEATAEAVKRAEAKTGQIEALLARFGIDSHFALPPVNLSASTAAAIATTTAPAAVRQPDQELNPAPPGTAATTAAATAATAVEEAEAGVALSATTPRSGICAAAHREHTEYRSEGRKGVSRESTVASRNEPAASDYYSRGGSTATVVTSSASHVAPGEEKVVSRATTRTSEATHPTGHSRGVPPLPLEVRSALEQCAEALISECRKTVERLSTQLGQRKSQLLRGLCAFVEGEEVRLSGLAASLARAPASPKKKSKAAASVSEKLHSGLAEVRELCRRAEALAAGGGDVGAASWLDELSAGRRCAARWLDGNFYDATVHRVLPDGSVIVNWLRPSPLLDREEGDRRPKTVSENGGDDSLHRIVAISDVRISPEHCSRASLGTASWLFENRQKCDRICVDCNSDKVPADWASVSFGTFLCQACASVHLSWGPEISFVREIRGGWGWGDGDLQYLVGGGNAAYLTSLESFPSVRDLPIPERYHSRFAEHYRRQLDARCCGTQAPAPLGKDNGSAALPMPPGSDFLSAAEAAEVAKSILPSFEAAIERAMKPSSPSKVRQQALQGYQRYEHEEDLPALPMPPQERADSDLVESCTALGRVTVAPPSRLERGSRKVQALPAAVLAAVAASPPSTSRAAGPIHASLCGLDGAAPGQGAWVFGGAASQQYNLSNLSNSSESSGRSPSSRLGPGSSRSLWSQQPRKDPQSRAPDQPLLEEGEEKDVSKNPKIRQSPSQEQRHEAEGSTQTSHPERPPECC